MSGHSFRFVLVLALFSASACRTRDEGGPSGKSEGTALAAAPTPTPTARPAAQREAFPTNGPRIVRPRVKGDDVLGAIQTEMAHAAAEGREVVVYVGATWCEPCQRFHEALTKGRLDAAFPTVTFLELDLDEARDGLARAGYASRLIPLFSVPAENGKDQGLRIEGGIKGDGAVTELESRLRSLLNKR